MTDAKTGVVVAPVAAPVVQVVCTDFDPIGWALEDYVKHEDPQHPGHYYNDSLKRTKEYNAKWDAVCKK